MVLFVKVIVFKLFKISMGIGRNCKVEKVICLGVIYGIGM